jgi:hypothetical protein
LDIVPPRELSLVFVSHYRGALHPFGDFGETGKANGSIP